MTTLEDLSSKYHFFVAIKEINEKKLPEPEFNLFIMQLSQINPHPITQDHNLHT